jgi:hypothetical protein
MSDFFFFEALTSARIGNKATKDIVALKSEIDDCEKELSNKLAENEESQRALCAPLERKRRFTSYWGCKGCGKTPGMGGSDKDECPYCRKP